MEAKWRCCVIILLSSWWTIDSTAIPGNDMLGTAYDVHYYAEPSAVDLTRPRAFRLANTAGSKCLEFQTSDDMKCSFIGSGSVGLTKVYSAQANSEAWSTSAGVSAGLGTFSTSVDTSYVGGYYYNTNYALTAAYGNYHYYSLSLNWEKRGLSEGFKNDIKKLTTCELAEVYGYFFLMNGYWGGEYLYSQSQSYCYQNSSSGMETSINSGWGLFSSSSEFGSQQSGSSTDASSSFKFTYKGCNYRCLQAGSTCDWQISCTEFPSLYAFSSTDGEPSLVSIGDVLRGFGYNDRADEADNCTRTYLNSFPSPVFTGLLLNAASNDVIAGVGNTGAHPVLSCPYIGEEYYVSKVSIGVVTKNLDWYGASFSSILCEYSPFEVDSPGSATSFLQVREARKENFPLPDMYISFEAGPGFGFVGLGWLVTDNCEGFDRYAVGIRMYVGQLRIRAATAPFVDSINTNIYREQYFLLGQPDVAICEIGSGLSGQVMGGISFQDYGASENNDDFYGRNVATLRFHTIDSFNMTDF